MTRLTNAVRDAIRDDILAHRFREPVLALLKEARMIGEDIYTELYPDNVQKRMQALPLSFFRTADKIRFYCLGERLSIYFGPYIEGLRGYHAIKLEERSVKDRIVAQCYYPEYSNVTELTKPLSNRIEKLIQERNRHNEAYDAARTQLTSSLAAVSSIPKLMELWPEVEPFAKKWLKESVKKPQLPAIPVASLNAMLDLPVDIAA